MLPGNYRAMWFIVSLVVMRLISSAFPKKIIPIAVISLPLALILKRYGVFSEKSDTFQLCTTMLCYHYFVFGYYLKKESWLCIFSKIKPIYSYMIIISGGVLFLVIGHFFVGRVNLFRGDMGRNAVLMILVSYGVSFLLMGGFSVSFKKNRRLIEILSEGTLLILCTHQSFIMVLDYFGIIGREGFIEPLAITIVIIAVSLLGIIVCKRYFPIFIGKNKPKLN